VEEKLTLVARFRHVINAIILYIIISFIYSEFEVEVALKDLQKDELTPREGDEDTK
jgi:hypothetical protein